MNQKLKKLGKRVLIASIVCLFNFSLLAQNTNNEEPSIDTHPFYDSVHHWYDFFSDGAVIHPLPGKPQYPETEITKIADNMLLFQRDNGGWPKNYDMRAILTDEQVDKLKAAKAILHTTFDNSTTYTQINYLAKAYDITHQERFKEGCLKGLQFILDAQYENGGWPQYYPPLPSNAGYSTHITFNDGAYVGVMNTLKRIADEDLTFYFIGKDMREKLRDAYDKGLDCILKTQIVEDGVKKIWCQQHDEVTLKPAWARTFEPPCMSNDESAPIVLLLMSIAHPNDKIIGAVQAAVKWFDSAKIPHLRCIYDPTAPKYVSKYKVHNYDARVVHDLLAPPIWPRYSELETGKPMFCDRDKTIVYHMSDLGRERRSGYRWYTYAPQQVLDAYPDWLKKNDIAENVMAPTN
ncbi:MAG TPA: pectate lyase [Sunxiuqinia sp.]|nr:pectate lyase [Sunxiuqinia sp.]